MEKKVKGTQIAFYKDGKEKMTMDFFFDEFIWYFNDSEEITITKDMDLYSLLDYILNQDYTFSNRSALKDYKDKNKLIWYSDCYYNPEDEISRKSVSFLSIKRENDSFKISCTKPIDEIVDRKEKIHAIAFSVAGNGKCAINYKKGSTLQDDFVQNVYYGLFEKNKVKKYK